MSTPDRAAAAGTKGNKAAAPSAYIAAGAPSTAPGLLAPAETAVEGGAGTAGVFGLPIIMEMASSVKCAPTKFLATVTVFLGCILRDLTGLSRQNFSAAHMNTDVIALDVPVDL